MSKSKFEKFGCGFKASVWYIVSNMIQKVLVLISTPVYTRCLSSADYGKYELYKSWLNILMVFATLNLFYSGYNSGITKYSEDKNTFTSSMVGVSCFIWIIFSSFFLIFEYNFDFIHIEYKYCIIMTGEILGMTIFNFWASRERYFYKYKKMVIISIITNMASTGCAIIAVLIVPIDCKLYYRIVIEAIGWILVGLYCFFDIYIKSKIFFVWKYWKYAICRNIPLIPHYLSNILLNQSDRIMIASMSGNSEAAKYSLAYGMSMFLTALSSAVQNALMPEYLRNVREGNADRIRRTLPFLSFTFCGICSIVTLLAPEIIILMAPKEYWNAKYVMPPVVFTIVFMFENSIFTGIEHYYGKINYIISLSCLSAILNIALNYVLIPTCGYTVAGYTTFICYFVMSQCHMFLTQKLLIENKVSSEIPLVLLTTLNVCSAIVMILLVLLYTHTYLRVGMLCLGVFICVAKKKEIIDLFLKYCNWNE